MNGYLNYLIYMLWTLGVILSVDAQESKVYSMHPDWSPDGTRICFASNRSGNDEIFIKNLGNGKTKHVTYNSVLDSYPNWSQDGSKIYYHSGSDGNWGIHVFDLETGDSNQLVASFSIEPVQSPNGQLLVYSAPSKSNLDLFLL